MSILKIPHIGIKEHNFANLKDNYIKQENAILFLFKSYPLNNTLEHVMIKVSVLNDFYSTNIFNTYTMAKHIFDNHAEIDSKLQQSDYSVVEKIANIKVGKEKNINFYSFATKYCAHHNDEFPIYDSFVAKMLLKYKKQDKFAKFTQQDLRRYEGFVEILNAFSKYYELTEYNYRAIDIFLWDYGRNPDALQIQGIEN